MGSELVPTRTLGVNETLELGKVMAASGYFNDVRDAGQAVIKILAGRELGLGPVSSMTGIYIIKNRISLSANLVATLIRRSGRYDFRVRNLTDQKCEIEFFMDGKSLGVSTFSCDDAKRAGLTGDVWKKFPKNMLFSRALTNGSRWYCPDVFSGPIYTPDELGAAIDAEEGSVIPMSLESIKVVEATVTISPEQVQELEQLLHRKAADANKMLSYYGVASLSDLTLEQHAEAVSLLRSRPDVLQVPQSAEPENGQSNDGVQQ